MSASELLYMLLSFLLGMLVFYITAYSKAKGKNRALQEDISRLEDEKQKIATKYRAETEELKKSHTLDIEKRKYQYDEKRKQFVKYFSLLDEFHGKCNAVFTSEFPPIMNKFMTSYLVEDKIAKNSAIGDFMESVLNILQRLNEELLKVKSETNSIRLISSDTLDKLINELEAAVQSATDDASEMLRFMATEEFWSDQSLLAQYQAKSVDSGQSVLNSRNAVRDRMKVELNEI